LQGGLEGAAAFESGVPRMSRPTDFFVGITDLFSIILPGMVLEFLLLLIEKQRHWDFLGLQKLSDNEGYVAFFIGAWLLGHAMDMLGAYAIDEAYDLLYAHWKRSLPQSFAAWLAETPGRLLSEARQALRGLGVTRERGSARLGDALFERAGELAGTDRPEGFNVYKWSRTWTMIQSAPAMSEIERLQANSKFFRGMVGVSAVAAITSFAAGIPFHDFGGVMCILFACASFLRYSDIRWKAVQQTYGVYIALRTIERRAERVAAPGGQGMAGELSPVNGQEPSVGQPHS
jgi:hypothetical protein